MKKKLVLLTGLVMMSPVAAFAQGVGISGSTSTGCDYGQGGTLFGVLCRVGQFLNSIVPVLIALGVVYFVWGVISFVMAGDEEAKTAGRDRIIFGIIGLAVIIGMWGLVNLLRNTFLLNNDTRITLPTVPVILDTPRR
ncbi:MAG: pilin [bacterium]|nr:pilin [bacterium]